MDIAQLDAINMETHRLTFGMIAVFSHAATLCAQSVIDVQNTIAGLQLHRLFAAQQPVQAAKMVILPGIDRLDLNAAIIAEQKVKLHQLFFIPSY